MCQHTVPQSICCSVGCRDITNFKTATATRRELDNNTFWGTNTIYTFVMKNQRKSTWNVDHFNGKSTCLSMPDSISVVNYNHCTRKVDAAKPVHSRLWGRSSNRNRFMCILSYKNHSTGKILLEFIIKRPDTADKVPGNAVAQTQTWGGGPMIGQNLAQFNPLTPN